MYKALSDLLLKTEWWRGLLAKLTIAYAFGSLILSISVAYFTFTIAQDQLIADFEESALIQFGENLIEARTGLAALPENSDEDPETSSAIINSVDEKVKHTATSDSILVLEGIGVRMGNRSRREIPEAQTSLIQESELSGMYYKFESEKRYIVGTRIENVNGFINADYHELHVLTELDETIKKLRRILIGAAILSGLAGATLGYYAAKRALSPISRVSSAAREMAAGNFQTKLDQEADPDLAILSSSFNEMVDKLRERVERDQRFTSDVSHELRSPLMTLSASIELLERDKENLSDNAKEAVELIDNGLKRFVQLVEDLLEISRMDAGAVQLQLTPFGLPEFLLQVISHSVGTDIELRHSNRDRNLVISADKRRMAQVLSNLISNAKKYAGGAKSISFRRIGDSVQITVEDEGPGIAIKDRQRIFERFSRATNDAGNRGTATGVGLGLSLVAEHVRLHGGKVWATDRIDGKQGSRFVVEIPVGEIFDTGEDLA